MKSTRKLRSVWRSIWKKPEGDAFEGSRRKASTDLRHRVGQDVCNIQLALLQRESLLSRSLGFR